MKTLMSSVRRPIGTIRLLTSTSVTKGGYAMKREKYERAEIDVIEFLTADVIMTSGDPLDEDSEEYEWIVPNK